MFGRALTSTLWGMLADRIGRKPVIVIGIFTGLAFLFHVYTTVKLHKPYI
jgi:MFS family permease